MHKKFQPPEPSGHLTLMQREKGNPLLSMRQVKGGEFTSGNLFYFQSLTPTYLTIPWHFDPPILNSWSEFCPEAIFQLSIIWSTLSQKCDTFKGASALFVSVCRNGHKTFEIICSHDNFVLNIVQVFIQILFTFVLTGSHYDLKRR